MLEILAETLSVGSVVAGAYRLERIVGEGGMGVVWAAREIATGRGVALKFLREGRETDVRNQERVLREARAAMAISHANIAKVEAVLETDAGVPFLVMELLEGESLRALLRRRGTLTPVECARILLPVVDAVLAAHTSQIVHRDLKPENVFLSGPAVRVLDFGIAKQLPKAGEADAASLTSTGALIGTPIYMAPEQVFGDDDIDGSADVWSLGIMLYECLAGKRPTDGEGFGPIIKRITTETLEPLEHARAGLPRRMTSLVARMLTRDRALRPALVEVRAVLASIADAGEGAAPSERAPDVPLAQGPAFAGSTTAGVAGRRATSDAPVVAPPAPRRRLGFALAALGVLGTLGGALFVARQKQAPRPAAQLPATLDTAPWVEASKVNQEAQAALKERDGVRCLQRLDRYDRELAGATGACRSTEPTCGYAGMRGMCMMLAGQCQQGEALYRKYITPWISDSGVMSLDETVESIAADYCEGDAIPAREALRRVNRRLGGGGAYQKTPTEAECREWSATEERLRPQLHGSLEQLGIYLPVETDLAMCLERAARKQ